MAPFPQSDDSGYQTELFFDRLNEALGELALALPRRVERARDDLLAACGLPPGEAGWRQLRAEAAELAPQVNHPQLGPLLKRAIEGGAEAALDSVLAYVGGRPPRTWTDSDADRFADQAAAIGRLYRQERLARLPFAHLTPTQRARSLEIAGALQAFLRAQFDDDLAIIEAALHMLQQGDDSMAMPAEPTEEQTV